MSRELTRDLFGEPQSPVARTASSRPTAEVPAIATTEDLKLVSFQLDTLSKKLKDFESRLESLTTKWDEFSSISKLKFERIQGHFQRQSEAIQSSFRDVHAKTAAMSSRINERKLSDANITDLVERHQTLVQTFEVRLQQMQKVMSEQELQLMNSRSELREALKELSRLKRG